MDHFIRFPPVEEMDARSSEALMASEMPEVGETVSSFKKKFAERSLSPKDLVVLSAAHTIGSTTCFFMTQRLHNFSSFGSDPTLDPALLPVLMDKCPKDGNVNERLGIDYGSEERIDTHILSNIRMGFAVLESDAKLYTDPETKFVLDSYFETPAPSFAKDFASAMLKMGNIGAGKQGEIRRVCNAVNS